ncbi:hypothetical protein BGL96_21655 [Vibrio parahaemolyticus]|uniref:hypothetical protein n=1 Tax=Vibrio parahaemolyticus TaxID=670 RepID=UPI000B51940C|nr:hypothetical protein [Vibrio parahaemolyticus]OWT92841.1 hypothetical protein BGL96_21655 [Vibrio parahaemolyticus]
MQGEIENQPDMDDWGDFSAVISGLEQTEVSELTDLPTEAANDDSKPAGEMFQGALSVLFTIAEQATTIISGVDFEFDEKGKAAVGEMFQGALSVLFTIAEQATTIISGVDFEFDEKGKAAVIDAALPVLEKHGDTVTSMFGNYMEEAVLGLAVLSLVYSAKKTMAYQKELLAIEEKKQREQKEKDAA